MNKRRVFFAALGMLIFPLSTLGWLNERDNRPVDELELMDDAQLAGEADGPCLALAVYNSMEEKLSGMREPLEDARAAQRYLDTVSLVVRKKHGGEYPQWLTDMRAASLGTDGRACSAVWLGVLKQAEANKKSQKRKVK